MRQLIYKFILSYVSVFVNEFCQKKEISAAITKRNTALKGNFMSSIEEIYRFLPTKLSGAIANAVKISREKLFEIHITLGGGSSVRFPSGKVFLGVTLLREDMDNILSALTGGALYAHRHTLSEGFLTLAGGVRVGICGQARYESERLVGVADVTSLLIRVPGGVCNFTDELVSAFLESERGMLIYAPASGGKTTALRALVARLAQTKTVGRISVIDERCELCTDELSRLDVDIFKGYRRAEGMRIALRVMSPEVIAVDEIGASDEGQEMLESLMSGVKFVATAHAKEYGELRRRKNLAPFFELGIFDTFVGIFNTDMGFTCEIRKEEDSI